MGYDDKTPIEGKYKGTFIKFHELTTGKANDRRGTRNKFFPGHSGSPVFQKDKTTVIGVLREVKNNHNTQREICDQDFRVISIDALSKFWDGLSRYKSTKSGINFIKLRDFLAQGEWKKANEETIALMMRIADRQEEKFLEENDINNFLDEDLRMIDSLWRKYSNDHFGISIQSEIYLKQGHRTIIKNENYRAGLIESFCNEVGWKQNGKYQEYDEIRFDINALKGHLPHFGKRISEQEDKGMPGVKGEFIYSYCLQYLYLRFTKFKLEQQQEEKAQILDENKRLKEELDNLKEKQNQNNELFFALHQEIEILKTDNSDLKDSFQKRSQELDQVKDDILSLKKGQIKIKSGRIRLDQDYHLKGRQKKLDTIPEGSHMKPSAPPEWEKEIYYDDQDSDFSFEHEPKIVLGICKLWHRSGTDIRVNSFIKPDAMKPKPGKRSFNVRIDTWWDSYIYEVEIYWIAYGK